MKTATENFLFAKICALLRRIKKLKHKCNIWKDEAMAERDRANVNLSLLNQALKDKTETVNELTTRIHEMAPEKQFRVLLASPIGGKLTTLALLAVQHLNGETTITVAFPVDL